MGNDEVPCGYHRIAAAPSPSEITCNEHSCCRFCGYSRDTCHITESCCAYSAVHPEGDSSRFSAKARNQAGRRSARWKERAALRPPTPDIEIRGSVPLLSILGYRGGEMEAIIRDSPGDHVPACLSCALYRGIGRRKQARTSLSPYPCALSDLPGRICPQAFR